MEHNKDAAEKKQGEWKKNTRRLVELERSINNGIYFCITFKGKEERDKAILRQVDAKKVIKESKVYKDLDQNTRRIILGKGVILRTTNSTITWILDVNNKEKKGKI